MEVTSSTPQISEQKRFAAPQSYGILNSPHEQSYDDITELASFICGTPISLISFIEPDRQWFKSTHGLTIEQTSLSHSFCVHAVTDPSGRPATLVIEDALADPRFRQNPLVTGEPRIRFYAGAPIVERNGQPLGAVCVIDRQPRTLTPRQVSALEALARQVVVLLVFPLRAADGLFHSFLTRVIPFRDEAGAILHWFGTNVEIDELQRTRLALEQSEAGLSQVLNATSDAVLSIRRDWTIAYVNPCGQKLYGTSATLLNRNLWLALPSLVYEGSPFPAHFQRAMEEGVTGRFEAEQLGPGNTTLGVEVYPSPDGIVVFARDVTQLKHATAAILQNEKLAAVGRLASSIAHEINNPLEAVTNLLYLARTSGALVEATPYLTAAMSSSAASPPSPTRPCASTVRPPAPPRSPSPSCSMASSPASTAASTTAASASSSATASPVPSNASRARSARSSATSSETPSTP